MGQSYVNILGHRDTLAKLQSKLCKIKVVWKFVHKILAKINIKEHILPIFLINVINILAKTIYYKNTKNKYISNTV